MKALGFFLGGDKNVSKSEISIVVCVISGYFFTSIEKWRDF